MVLGTGNREVHRIIPFIKEIKANTQTAGSSLHDGEKQAN